MLIEDLSRAELTTRLRTPGLDVVTGAFTFRLHFDSPHLVEQFAWMYGAFEEGEPGGIVDAVVRLTCARVPWPPFLRRIRIRIDDERRLEAPEGASEYTALESALNWSIALSDVAPFLVHAAVVERDGRAILFPAASGSGKSTLCAALVCAGWRLLSDEMAIFRHDDFTIAANPRPVSLKNASIGIITQQFPDADMGPVHRGTARGDLAYLRPPRSAALRCQQAAPPALILAPRYVPGAIADATRLHKVAAFRLVTENAVNYASMLQHGFDIITRLVEDCACYALTYGSLDDALRLVDELHRDGRGAT